MATYKVIRMYQRRDVPSEVVRTGLTLEEAQAHCNDPQTSWSTCSTEEGLRRTMTNGPWFDGFTEELP